MVRRAPSFLRVCRVAVWAAPLIAAAWAAPVLADDGPPSAPESPPPAAPLSPDARIDFAAKPPEPEVHPGAEPAAGAPAAVDLDLPPPVRPRRRGLVLESTIGVLGFAGQFRHVSPPAYWMRAQLGYELTRWLMAFGEGEFGFTDTGESQSPSDLRAFWMWGFAGGARATAHASERIAGFFQAEVGALTAYVPHGALANLGFRSAESLGVQFGGKVGVEWYQKDPHLALSLQGGARDAVGFARLGGGDLPLMWDAALALRYTF